MTSDALLVACLCAEWCGVCRDWRATFVAQASAHPRARFAWIDIEDEADAMGEVDVETFPTLLVARGDAPLFLGPVLPSGDGLTRLLASLEAGAAPLHGAEGTTARGLLQRLQGPVLDRSLI